MAKLPATIRWSASNSRSLRSEFEDTEALPTGLWQFGSEGGFAPGAAICLLFALCKAPTIFQLLFGGGLLPLLPCLSAPVILFALAADVCFLVLAAALVCVASAEDG